MDAPLGLSNFLLMLLAIVCLWTMLPQSRGGVLKLWRLAMPACLALVQALMLLAGVFDATLGHDAEWIAALIVGGIIDRTRGWALAVQVDRKWSLVRVQPAFDGMLAAFALVALATIDFISAAVEEPVVTPVHVAAAAALLAGFIGCRALAMATRATRAPHVELHGA